MRQPSLECAGISGIDMVSDTALVKCFDSLRDIIEETLTCLATCPGDMGRDNQIGNTRVEEGVPSSRRFGRQYIDTRATDNAMPQCMCQSGFVDNATAGAIDQKRIGFHQCQSILSNQIFGVLGQGYMQAQYIDLR